MPHYVSVQLAATLRLRTTLAEFPHSALPFEQWATRWPTSEARPLRVHPRILRPCRSRPPSAAFSCRSRSPSRATRWAALCSRSRPAKKRTRERRAGSIPIKWYAAFDHWARALPPGPLRIWVRSVLIAWLSYRLRLVDVLRTRGRLYVCE